jgi:hypothetical protein
MDQATIWRTRFIRRQNRLIIVATRLIPSTRDTSLAKQDQPRKTDRNGKSEELGSAVEEPELERL